MARADLVPRETKMAKIGTAWIGVQQILACEREFDKIQMRTTIPKKFEDAVYWLREMARYAREADRLLGVALNEEGVKR